MQTERKSGTVRPATSFGCTICQSTFGRLEHLQRHTIASHSSERPFPCTFCAQSFARRDVLSRHLKSCKSKSSTAPSAPSIPTIRRGRKRRSCDACVRLKRACSGTQPCLYCVHRKQSCCYTVSCAPGKPEQDEKNEFLPSKSAVQSHHAPQLDQVSGASLADDPDVQREFLPVVSPASRLAFLANLTSTHGLADTFDCGTAKERSELMQNALLHSQFDNDFAFDRRKLVTKSEIAITSIKTILQEKHEQSWSAELEKACQRFFDPVNLEQNLLSYFTLWHQNCPIIHRAMFDLKTAPAALLASMVLIGACLSPISSQQEAALHWLDPVEHWVFSTPEFTDRPLPLQPESATDEAIQGRLDALRAGYCMILLQSWEGTGEAKRRARRSRYTEIIGVFRSICGSDLTHGDLNDYLDDPPSSAKWKSFAVIEELIRTSTYIFLLDSAYAIFNNTPPRMAFREARMALTCPEPCFEAETLGDWADTMRMWAATEIGQRQTTLTQTISVLYLEQIPPSEWLLLQQTSCLNMFALIHLLHVQLFHMRCHPMPGSQTPLQRQALDNWKRVWAQRTIWQDLVHTSDSAQKQGFYKYAPEFWCLADHFLASSEAAHLTDFDQTTAVNENLIAQLLSRYDESDMSQVHDLVSLFGNLSLEL